MVVAIRFEIVVEGAGRAEVNFNGAELAPANWATAVVAETSGFAVELAGFSTASLSTRDQHVASTSQRREGRRSRLQVAR